MTLSEKTSSTAEKADLVQKLQDWILRDLSPRRYQHSLEVARLCASLCRRFDVEPRRGFLMGLGHDIAREYSARQLKSTALRDGSPISSAEEKNPILLHGRAGALVLQENFGFDDPDILQAVRTHTLGSGDAGPLAKILYVADFCEPSRKFISSGFRKSCLEGSLDTMVRLVIEEKWRDGLAPAPATRALYAKVKGESGEG